MFALTVGFSIVAPVVNVIAPGPETFDREYHEMPAISPVAVILIRIPVLVNLSAHILSSGAVLSIL